ncbi:MAG: UDP-N-acetylglucosamine 1-carboxyvinyltransferase, partial [Bacillota bacterium]
MAKYIINGGKKLYGDVMVQGAKNAVLPLLAASIMTTEKVVISNCPDIVDVDNMFRILFSLGVDIERRGDQVTIDSSNINSYEISHSLARELRSSIFLLGSVLARTGSAKVAYPGGCDIGLRPIDIHLKGLQELGVKIEEKYGYIVCDASYMRGNNITLDYPSVGATENIMLLATKCNGVTTISNPAREPEIEELQIFLNKM